MLESGHKAQQVLTVILLTTGLLPSPQERSKMRNEDSQVVTIMISIAMHTVVFCGM